MGLFYKLGEGKILIIIEMSIAALIGIVHFVFFFFIKETDFNNIFNSFESSPLFDFSIDDNCGIKSQIIFHIWEGKKELYHYYSGGRLRSSTKMLIELI